MAQPTQCYIFDPFSGDMLTLQNAPTMVREKRGAQLKVTTVPGFSHPRVVASAGEAHTISFNVEYYAEDEETYTPRWVIQQMQWLLSLTYARVVSRELGTRRIIPVYLVLGGLIELPVYVQSVTPQYGPFQDANLEPLIAVAAIECIEVPDTQQFIDVLAARSGRVHNRSWEAFDEDGLSLGTFLSYVEEFASS